MRLQFSAGSCVVRRGCNDVAYASDEYGERKFLLDLSTQISRRHNPIDAPTGFLCRKTNADERRQIDAGYALVRTTRRPGQIWAIYYETSRGSTAAEEFTSHGRVRLAVARAPRRSRCRKL